MLEDTNEAIRRGTGRNRKKWRLVSLLQGTFRLVYVVGKIFDLIKWIIQLFGE